MNAEIVRLKLPRGVWQKLIKQEIPLASHVECSYPDAQSVRFQLFENAKMIAYFTMSFLQGCSGILVSHNMMVLPEFQGRGIAKKLQPIKTRVAQDLKVSVLLATVKEDNAAEKKVIKDWQHVDSFKNAKTGNTVGIHIKKIEPYIEEITIDACGKNIEELVIDNQPVVIDECKQDYSS